MIKSLLRHSFLLLFISAIVAGMYGLESIHRAVKQPLMLSEPQQVLLVGQGDTLTKVVNKLAADGIIQNPRWLLLYAKWQKQTSIRAGEYALSQDMTGESLLQCLTSGRVIQYQITFVEGSTLADNMSALTAQSKLINDVKSMDSAAFQAVFGFEPNRAEGWFFPDTYSYVSGMRISDVLLQAHHRMRAVLDEEWSKRAKELPYKNPYEALIMASIVEKETGVASERKQIAGVFVRRLQKGMRLQTDPTVIYGLGSSFKGNLKRSHLQEMTPYNTYMIDGLPPTPIALPGREAIHAALHPAPGKALFFVAKGDGTHMFSDNLGEHERAVDEFQLRPSRNYRSSPPASQALSDDTSKSAAPAVIQPTPVPQT